MEKKEIEIGSPLKVGGVTIIPVIKSSVSCWRYRASTSFFGIKQPVSVVVVSASEKKAFRITGEEVPLDQLIQEVPAVEKLVGSIG